MLSSPTIDSGVLVAILRKIIFWDTKSSQIANWGFRRQIYEPPP